MKKYLSSFLALGFVFVSISFVSAQNSLWTVLEADNFDASGENIKTQATEYALLQLDGRALQAQLANAPHESSTSLGESAQSIKLPLPDGTWDEFHYHAYDAIDPAALSRFPLLQAYKGVSKTTGNTVRFDFAYNGFNAYINTAQGEVFIERHVEDSRKYYASFYGSMIPNYLTDVIACQAHDDDVVAETAPHGHTRLLPTYPLRTYRLAVTTTGEWARALGGGTVEGTISEILNVTNRINTAMERDFAIRLVLISNNDLCIFLDGNDDPFNNGDAGDLMSKSTGVLNTAVGAGAYDIGHAFGTNTGGVAQLGSVCRANKGAGSSSTFGAYRTTRFFHIVAHEMGHMLTATHTFNWCEGENETGATAYEPGSGSTIMSYAGASNCENRYIQNVSDPYYHSNSIERVVNFIRNDAGSTCGTDTEHENTAPVAMHDYEDGFFIPIGTPFYLEGSGVDAEDDDLTYCWEQFDLGPLSQLGSPVGNAPLFRSFPPSEESVRVFPELNKILFGATNFNETLPTTSRDMTFRLTVRDNNPEAGLVDFTEVSFKSTASAGPFEVSTPLNNEVLEIGDFYELIWAVSNTDQAPVNCQSVNVYYATNGIDFEEELASDVPNNGRLFIPVPADASTGARIAIEAADNIFFNISDRFQIQEAQEAGFGFAPAASELDICLPAVSSLDLLTLPKLDFDGAVSFSVEGLPDGVTASFSQNPVTPGENAVMNIDFGDYQEEGSFNIVITATADSAETVTREVTVTTTNTDFSALAPDGPADGSTGLSVLPDFAWTGSPYATSYSLEIATEADFEASSIVEAATGITETSYTPSIALEENTLYFWRVSAENKCAESKPTQTFSFHTLSLTCGEFTSDDTPIEISNGGMPTIESRIPIPSGSNIVDVNVPYVRIIHDFVSDLKLTLISPSNTEVVLVDQKCANLSNIDQGYDDESPEPFACPLTDGKLHVPDDPLSSFNGEDAMGLWTLRVEDNRFGGGGRLTSWQLELCADLSLAAPELISNETLFVMAREQEFILNDLLSTTDPNNGPGEIRYTITEATAHGVVKVNGRDLGVGDSFTQLQIDNGELKYLSLQVDSETDFFRFVITDGEGGYIGAQRFNIRIDLSSATGDLELSRDLMAVSPNPAQEYLIVETTLGEIDEHAIITLTDLNAKAVQSWRALEGRQRLDLQGVPASVYLLSLQTEDKIQVEKLIIQQ